MKVFKKNRIMISAKTMCLLFSNFLLVSCTSIDNTKSKEGLSVVTNSIQKWEVLASGMQCDITSPKQVLIKNQADFNKLWQETFSRTGIESVKPVVDFTSKWVLAAYIGKGNSGGHSIGIKEINGADNTIIIILKHLKPGSGCATAAVIAHPYTFVSVEHFLVDKTEFKVVQEEYKCE